ncbi:MAG: glutamate--tRNA ligase [Nanoarchaeota archaeon]
MKDIKILALENAVKHKGKADHGTVVGHLLAKNPELRKKSKEIVDEVMKMVEEINSLSLEEQTKALKKLDATRLEKKEIIEDHSLPNLETRGKVVMRIAPYPSGPLHIGNARPSILNDEYVKKYGGKLILFMDDTIGSEAKNISKDSYKLIRTGLDWLKVKYDKEVYYKSDRLEIYYKYAKKLIKRGRTYVCTCNSTTLRSNREKGIPCKCRRSTIQHTLKAWEEMFTAKEGSMALRLKTNIEHPNPAFRDRVVFRISDREHPRVKKKYRVWPLLDFSWAIDDHLLKMTHILRGKDLMIETDMEKYIWKVFGWKEPKVIHHGLLQLEGVKLSKSKFKKEVESGEYTGWDDPRTWSLQSLKKRGILPEAIRNFILEFGLNQNEITAPVERLYSENKKLIDKKVNRYFFIEDPKKIKIKKSPLVVAKCPLHPDDEKRGYRVIKTAGEFYVQEKPKDDTVYRFMHLFNFKNNQFISLKYDKDLGAKMIHWLPVSDKLVETGIVMPDGSVKKGLSEEGVRKLKVGETIQFERNFFACLYKKSEGIYTFYFTHR